MFDSAFDQYLNNVLILKKKIYNQLVIFEIFIKKSFD